MSRRALVLGGLLVLTPACGGNEAPPPVAPAREVRASWQDVFDTMPDIYAVVRPQALKRDPVYGSLWKTLLRIAEARRIVTGPSTLEAAEESEEIIVGLNPGMDGAIVFRGVPASLDPNRITDAEGRPLFKLVDERAKIPEYELLDRRTAASGSVFVLPDRTWVGTFGDARQRARTAFSSPFGRPALKVDADALGLVRFGKTFVQQPRYVKSPVWSAFTKRLNDVTLALKPEKGGLVASLRYADPDAAAYAETQARLMVEELSTDEKRFGWLKDAKVASESSTVIVQLPLPARLLRDLPNASGADLSL